MGSCFVTFSPGRQDAVHCLSCSARCSCCPAPAASWFISSCLPQLPLLWGSCPSWLPHPRGQRGAHRPHPQHKPCPDPVLPGCPGCQVSSKLPSHCRGGTKCCPRTEHSPCSD